MNGSNSSPEPIIKMEEVEQGVWNIPVSDRYISDSESPLSLLPPSPSSLASSIIKDNMSSVSLEQEASLSLSEAVTSMMTSSYYYRQEDSSFSLSYPIDDTQHLNRMDLQGDIVLFSDEAEEEEEVYMYHYDAIASNEAILCVRPTSTNIIQQQQKSSTTTATSSSSLSSLSSNSSALTSCSDPLSTTASAEEEEEEHTASYNGKNNSGILLSNDENEISGH